MRASTLHEIRVQLVRIEGSITTIHELQTGRDTHPLFDESAAPLSMHVAHTIADIDSRIRGLNELLGSYDEWAHDHSTPPDLPEFEIKEPIDIGRPETNR